MTWDHHWHKKWMGMHTVQCVPCVLNLGGKLHRFLKFSWLQYTLVGKTNHNHPNNPSDIVLPKQQSSKNTFSILSKIFNPIAFFAVFRKSPWILLSSCKSPGRGAPWTWKLSMLKYRYSILKPHYPAGPFVCQRSFVHFHRKEVTAKQVFLLYTI